ncbi:unnamed protein product [Brassica oleracea]
MFASSACRQKSLVDSSDTICEGTDLLRLHSTYRHDLKIYNSDEGRVQMYAAAFAKGLLDLEGQLTPILVSLVSKNSSMVLILLALKWKLPRITYFLTQGLEKETVNHLCCYNETNDNKSQVKSIGTVLSIDLKDVGAKKSIILYDV